MKKLLLATALAGLAGTAMAQDVVRLGTEGAYPPYNFINDAGEVAGFERELGDEMCKRAGLTCEWVTNAWDSIIPMSRQARRGHRLQPGLPAADQVGLPCCNR